MTFNFTDIIDRRGKDALAIDAIGTASPVAPTRPRDGFTPIPMWIADMSFATAPAITEAMRRRLEHPLFGYFEPSDEFYSAIINWHRKRGHTDLEPEHVLYENGVLGGVIAALNALATPGDKVLVHSPTYIGFEHTLANAGFEICHCELVFEDGQYRIDYELMERQIEEQGIHALVFCNPQNPTGRVWTRDEIARVAEICERHEVWIVSDEIWSDIILEGSHTPTQSVSEWARTHTAAFYAPSKTFSLAGLVGAYGIVYDKWLRDRVQAVGSKSVYNSMNVLWQHALIGAYSPQGEQWLGELRDVLRRNIAYAYEHITTHYPGIQVAKSQGTYMLLLDCREFCAEHGIESAELLKQGWDVGVGWQDARPFQVPYGLRMNLALPFSLVEEAFRRLDEHVFKVADR